MGNPITDPEAYNRIQSYAPYENLAQAEYPPVLVTAGLTNLQGDLLGAMEIRGPITRILNQPRLFAYGNAGAWRCIRTFRAAG